METEITDSPTLVELTDIHYEQVSVDHHKDRDCHFYINQVYSYGQEPYWRIEHYGYMQELPDELEKKQFDSDGVARQALYKWLYATVKEEIEFYLNYKPDPNTDYNWQGAVKVAEKYKHRFNL